MPVFKRNISWSFFGFSLAAVLFLMTASCQKDAIDNDPGIKLEFSQDTVFFDTVFTSIGTVTKYVTVHNTSSEKVRISSIRLAGGTPSSASVISRLRGEATEKLQGPTANRATPGSFGRRVRRPSGKQKGWALQPTLP